jgi:hypothetical protein
MYQKHPEGMAAPYQDPPAGRAEEYFPERYEDLDCPAGGTLIGRVPD